MSFLSRYAEHLFWLGRYIERVSNMARIIDTHVTFDLGREEETSWAWLIKLHSDEENFAKAYDEPSYANAIKFYFSDLENPGSIRSSLRAARENARALRAVIPTEMWQQINEFYNRNKLFTEFELDPIRLSRTCERIKLDCAAQLGVAEGTLYRDEGWCFFYLGTLIERADQTSRLLDVKFAQLATGVDSDRNVADSTFWSLVLRSAVAYQVFHRFEPRGADPNRVAKFLLVNASHPRSVAHCVTEIQSVANRLRRAHNLHQIEAAQGKVDALMAMLDKAAADPDIVAHLHGSNDQLQRGLIDLTSTLATTFFHVAPPEADDADKLADDANGAGPQTQAQALGPAADKTNAKRAKSKQSQSQS